MDLVTWKALAETVQAFATVAGFGVAGAWTYLLFIRRRQRFPRVEICQRATVFDVSTNQSIVHVHVTLNNIGDVLVSVVSAKVHVGQVLPLVSNLYEKLSKGEDLVLPGCSDIRWPTLGLRECDWTRKPCEIEPGEADDFHFDILVPKQLELIEVYSYFQNAAKRGKGIGWRNTSFIKPDEVIASSPLIGEKGESNGKRIGISRRRDHRQQISGAV